MGKLLILGLDGATFDVINPLIQEGHLPNIKKIINNGMHGELHSTIPPITGPAWLAMATGLSPGKTGAIDFLFRKDEKSYKLSAVTSYDFKGRALWDILSKHNKKVIIYNYPMLYPPYKVNGIMSSGIGTIYVEDSFYPKDVYDEIKNIVPDYVTVVNYHDPKYEDIELYYNDALIYFEKFKKVFFYLLEKKEWDLFFGVLSLSDWTQHLMWSHWEDKNSKFRKHFIEIWDKIDSFIGELRNKLNDTNFIIVSDHGFGKQSVCFNLSRWLYENGFMRRESERPFLSRIFSKSKSKTKQEKVSKDIDFKRSQAFCIGHTLPFGGIYINAEKNTKKYEKIYNKIVVALRQLEKEYENKIRFELYKPTELYAGPRLNLLPDIILTVNNWSSVVYEDDLEKPIIHFGPHSTRHTGSHRLNGIFIAEGPNISAQKEPLKNLRIFDIFPTAISMLGLDIPENDGCTIDFRCN